MKNSTLLLFLCMVLCPPTVFIIGPILLFQMLDERRDSDDYEYED